ncbi:tRNA dihydrouridine(20/20a) synthase DusA [Marinihelvus fidelis]|nr:tRNA dihydrouridine(20/20a) synthase DusA [Marinihelvus fidelis]
MTYTHDKDSSRLSVAPMMAWTDRHCRYFHRRLAPSALLYTEMVTTGAVLHGDRERLLAYNPEEHPVALQLGGSEPADLAASAKVAVDYGYDEINLNVGCPSDRVQKGRFGACLMKEPDTVRDGLKAMADVVDVPVTVKTRLGVDELYSYDYFRDFVGRVTDGTGVDTVIAHARIAFLAGLSPKENRDVPPLHHDWVYRLKQEMPHLTVVLNGGVETVDQVTEHLAQVDGVMLGRAAYHDPWVLARCQHALLGGGGPEAPEDVLPAMTAYLERLATAGVPVKHATRHMLGLFGGQPGARAWRRYLSENAHRDDADTGLLDGALAAMREVQAA